MNEFTNLDLEFKRYLYLLRPYLGQLTHKDVIKTCEAWIQRFSLCDDSEKVLRNKYIFRLCYQLAKGILEPPFLDKPPANLKPLSEELSDDSSTDVEYVVINADEPRTKVIYDSKKNVVSDTDSFCPDEDRIWGNEAYYNNKTINHEIASSQKTADLFHRYPEILEHDCVNNDLGYECRANNLVKKLREIKMQNILLQREILSIKEDNCLKVDNTTSPLQLSLHSNDSKATLKSLKYQLQDVQESRNILIQTVSNLQEQLDNLNDIKNNQIQDMEAKHKLELIKVKIDIKEEIKLSYEKKLQELKEKYENTIKNIQVTASNEIKVASDAKELIIFEKNKQLEEKNKENEQLKHELDLQKLKIQSMLSKYSEDTSGESLRLQKQMLEKQVNRIERSKIKCAKSYEAKISQLQRDKYLSKCSLHLQLIRQRTQIVTDLTDENQQDLNTSLEKLENKYKTIVANVQAAAIQRRVQDQKALESLIQTVYSLDDINLSQCSTPAQNISQSFETTNSPVVNKVRNAVMGIKVSPDDNLLPNLCTNGGRAGDFINSVYVSKADNGELK